MANKTNVKKWVKALRSGKFKQCTGKLSSGAEHCCLGVVCVLAGMKPRKEKESGNIFFGRERGELPLKAQRWLGVADSDPFIGKNRAIFWNDIVTLSFSEIADKIEKYGVK